MNSGFYEDVRYCPRCETYRRYLQALDEAYCAGCGGKVSIYSQEDLGRVLRSGSAGWGQEDDGAILRELSPRPGTRGRAWRARAPGRR